MTRMPDVTSPRVIRELFDSYGLNPCRQLGQNFLVDANIVRKILAAAEIKPGDALIEVGPGAGALTLPIASMGVDIAALEIDQGLACLLKELLQLWPKVAIIKADALKVCWKDLIGSHFDSELKIKLISNLPYIISGPFMYNLFKQSFPFDSAVLMFQKEVAHRLLARPGDKDYGALSVLSSYYASGKMLFEVSANVFWPRPKVGSAVIRMQPRIRKLNSDEEELLWYLVRGVFLQRRKTMLNSMIRLFPNSRCSLSALMMEALIDPSVRPEQLSADQFANLARITYNYHN